MGVIKGTLSTPPPVRRPPPPPLMYLPHHTFVVYVLQCCYFKGFLWEILSSELSECRVPFDGYEQSDDE